MQTTHPWKLSPRIILYFSDPVRSVIYQATWQEEQICTRDRSRHFLWQVRRDQGVSPDMHLRGYGDTASPQIQGGTTHPNTRASLVCPCPFSPTPLTSHSGSCAVCCDGALGYTTSPSRMPCAEHHLLYVVILGILCSLERSRNIQDRSV